MDFRLSEEQDLLRRSVREFAETEIRPHVGEWTKHQHFPAELMPKLAALGLLGIQFPEEYGGAAMSAIDYCICIEELARVDPGVALSVAAHNGLCSAHIFLFGSEAQKQTYLTPLVRGETIGAWGLTESTSGSDAGRIGIAALAVGLAQGAYEASVSYARERRAFGKTIGSFQAIQWKLADAATKIEAARLLTYRAAYLKERRPRTTLESSMAKLYASEIAVRVAEDAGQIHGGYGFVKDYPVEKYFRDVKLTTIGEGTSEIQRLVIARQLLSR